MVQATSLLLALGALVGSAMAVDHPVAVAQSGLVYVPSTVTAAVGDTVTFTFINGRHTVTQSSLEAPCAASAMGFASGVIQTGTTYTLAITSTDPIYFFCQTGSHCTAGMVGGINLPGNFDAFLAAAGSATVTPAASVVSSGVGAQATVLGGAATSASSGATGMMTTAMASTTGAESTRSSTAAPTATSATGGASAVKLSGAALFLATVFGVVAL